MLTPYNSLLNLLSESCKLRKSAGDVKAGMASHRPVDSPSRIDALEAEIEKRVERLLQSPLCLVANSQPFSPLHQHLEKALFLLDEWQVAGPKIKEDFINQAWDEVQQAAELLKLEKSPRPTDQTLIRLFQADILEKQGDYDNAELWVKKALDFPKDNELQMVTARLIQAKICSNSSTGRIFEGQNAYADALRRLEKLRDGEAIRESRCKEKLYRLLIKELQKGLSKSRVWKMISESSRVVPIIGEADLIQKKPLSADAATAYVEYTHRDGFEVEGQRVKFRLLTKDQATFVAGYDYVAMRVSDNSMDKAGISRGDYVVLKISSHANPGDIVAVGLEKEKRITLRRFLQESSHTILESESSDPQYQPFGLELDEFAEKDAAVSIVGIALAVLRLHELEARFFKEAEFSVSYD